jgi:hypothetical protein
MKTITIKWWLASFAPAIHALPRRSAKNTLHYIRPMAKRMAQTTPDALGLLKDVVKVDQHCSVSGSPESL